MSSDPLTSTSGAAASAADRQPAVWPWLLLPLVMLALFFGLREVKQGSERRSSSSVERTSIAVESAPGEASGSR
jgi:hypothetical protein